jgi:glycosyltransferase involved in cell wall biosynthesis
VNAFERDAPTQIMAHVAKAASRRFDCKVVALARDGALRSAFSFCETDVLHMQSLLDIRGFSRLHRLLESYRPHVVHVTLLRPTLIAAAFATFRPLSQRPVVIITHNGIHEWHEGGRLAALLVPSWYRWVAKRADRIVAVSFAARKDLMEAGIPGDKVDVIHNGVDAEVFKPGKHISEKQTLLVAAAGNLRRIKGHELLVEAAAVAAAVNEDLAFVLWGDGLQRNRLEEMIREKGLTERFRVPGHAGNLPDLLPQTDIFVQPSLQEAFGMAAAEAMSCGVPVIVSDAGGLPELVSDGVTGLVFPAGNVAELSTGIIKLASDPAMRERMGHAARTRVVEHFSLSKTTDEYLSLYNRLLTRETE